MATNPTPIVLTDPKGIDLALFEIQTKLTGATGLDWLTNAYGKAEYKKEVEGNNNVVYPAVYAGNREYLKLFPDSHLGNFCFFIIEDNEEILTQSLKNRELKSNLSLIFWFDFDTVYPFPLIPDEYSVENVKDQVSTFFKQNVFINSAFEWNNNYQKGNNIYDGFTDKEIDNQFLMRPYGGFRLEGTITYFEKSNNC